MNILEKEAGIVHRCLECNNPLHDDEESICDMCYLAKQTLAVGMSELLLGVPVFEAEAA